VKSPTFPDKLFLSKTLGTERSPSKLSNEDVRLMRREAVFLKEPANEGSLLILGECPSSERPLLVDQAFSAPLPPSESELSA